MAKRQVETASSTGYNTSPEMILLFFLNTYSFSFNLVFMAEKVQAASPADAATLILPDRRSQGCPLPGPPPGPLGPWPPPGGGQPVRPT